MSFLDDIGGALMSVARPLVSTLAPAAGSAIGGLFGPAGAAFGGSLGNSFAGLFGGGSHGGGDSQPQQPQQQPMQPQFQQMGQNYGQQFGQGIMNRMSPYMPAGSQGMALGALPQYAGAQMGRGLGQGFANRFQGMMPQQTFGQMAGNFANRIGQGISSRLPAQFQGFGQRIGQGLGGFAQSALGRYADQSPYSMMQQLPQYAENYGRGLGRQAGQMMSPYMSREMRTMPYEQALPHAFGQAGAQIGRFGGQQFDNRFGGGGHQHQALPQPDYEGAGMSEIFPEQGYKRGGHVKKLSHLADDFEDYLEARAH